MRAFKNRFSKFPPGEFFQLKIKEKVRVSTDLIFSFQRFNQFVEFRNGFILQYNPLIFEFDQARSLFDRRTLTFDDPILRLDDVHQSVIRIGFHFESPFFGFPFIKGDAKYAKKKESL